MNTIEQQATDYLNEQSLLGQNLEQHLIAFAKIREAEAIAEFIRRVCEFKQKDELGFVIQTIHVDDLYEVQAEMASVQQSDSGSGFVV